MAMPDQISAFPDAVEVLEDRGEPAGRHWKCVVGGRVVGYRHRYDDGTLALEYEVDADGRMHGLFREWHKDGTLSFESHYEHGLEHGEARQYDHDGKLIGTYSLHLGTGVDLWRDDEGRLQEERHLKDGRRHGFERWWNGDDRSIREERHYRDNVEHGIRRQWNSRGRLRRGYPQFYVSGERVTKRRYVAVSRADPTLPQYLKTEDQPERQLPPEHANSADQGAHSQEKRE